MITHKCSVISGVEVRISIYTPLLAGVSAGRREIHVTLIPAAGSGGCVSDQLHRIIGALAEAKSACGINDSVTVMKRVFLSDVANQAASVSSILSSIPGALSVIGQPPCHSGVKVAMLAIMMTDVIPTVAGNTTVVQRPPYTDIWTMSLTAPEAEDSYKATHSIFSSYISSLAPGTLAGDCKRTWLFMRDIDTRYAGMVKARNEVFRQQGLSPSHGFVASTGIEGASGDPRALVTFDAFAVRGLQQGQARHLSAPDNMNATTDYGVAFERATAITYGDRTHIFVSGTASIGAAGEIVAPGDVALQTQRVISNIEALLADGNGALTDAAHAILYVRDMADADIASGILSERMQGVPFVAVHAPVCRPGWLVEIECIAVTGDGNSGYAAY